MWLVTITCSADAWKRHGADFKAMADKYQASCVSSKKVPDGKRFMEYKVEDVGGIEPRYVQKFIIWLENSYCT